MSYIDWDDFDDNNVFILNKVVHLDDYDMYYVKFNMNDGKTKVVRVFCDKGSIRHLKGEPLEKWKSVLDYDSESSRRDIAFLWDGLVGEDGLMAEQGRDDLIYLGEGWATSGGWHDDINDYVSVGKTKQQVFEDRLFRLKLQLQAIEGQQVSRRSNGVETREQLRYSPTVTTQKSNRKGKHYAISDVHGMYGSYIEAMKRMSPNDHLYIIGDVIDRGSEGIRILQDIIRRKNDPRNNPEIMFLLGNHEWQFLHCLDSIKRFNLTEQEVRALAMSTHLKNNLIRRTFKTRIEEI